jgi:hypothetical protein
MAKKSEKKTIVIHNIKSTNYRQVHIDGAHGGITPNGFINVNFFGQRAAIPKGTEFSINELGELKDAIKDIDGSKSGIVREFEFGAYMDINTCISIKNFLEMKIEEFKQLTNQI